MATTTYTTSFLRFLARQSRSRVACSSPSQLQARFQASSPHVNMTTRHETTDTAQPPGAATSLLPPSTWDSHMHIVSPDTTTYPLSPSTTYTPTPHTLADMHNFYSTLSTTTNDNNNHTINPVFIQPSPYGTDNSLLLSALRTFSGPTQARGVVVIDPHNPPPLATLQAWHDLGVRGVRVNLVSVGRELTRRELEAELLAYADVVRPLQTQNHGGKGWVLQLYIRLRDVEMLEGIVPKLLGDSGGFRAVVVDHLGSPTLDASATATSTNATASTTATATTIVQAGSKPEPVDPQTLDGFPALLRLLNADSPSNAPTYVKISGWYRVTQSADINDPTDLDALVKALLRANGGGRCVWASDWPHTRFEGRGLDSKAWVRRLWALVREVEIEEGGTGEGGEERVQRRGERLFGGNAVGLWDGE